MRMHTFDEVMTALATRAARLRMHDECFQPASLQLEAPAPGAPWTVHPPSGPPLLLEEHARSQLWRLLDLQPATMRRLDPSLALEGTRRALPAYLRRLRLRIANEERVRAVLPLEEHRIEDSALLRLLNPVFLRHEGHILRFEVDDAFFALRVDFPDSTEELRVGDVVRRGVELRNSEIGTEPTRLADVVCRIICSNLSEQDYMQWRHPSSLAAVSDRMGEIDQRVAQFKKDAGLGGLQRAFEVMRQSRLLDRARAVKAFASLTHLGALREPVERRFLSAKQSLVSGELELLEPSAMGLWNATTSVAREIPAPPGDAQMRGVPKRKLSQAAGRLLDTAFLRELMAEYASSEK